MQKYRLVSIYVNIHTFFYSLLTIIRKSGIRQLRGAGCAGREVSADYLLVFGNYNVILENCTLFSALSLFIRLFAAKEPCPFPLGVRRICNPPLKNVLTYLGFADLQSATSSLCFLGLLLGDCKSPGFNRSNLFLRRISNPPGRLAGDFLFWCLAGKVHFIPIVKKIIKIKMQAIMLHSKVKTVSLQNLSVYWLPDEGNTVGERMWWIITKMVRYEIY